MYLSYPVLVESDPQPQEEAFPFDRSKGANSRVGARDVTITRDQSPLISTAARAA